MTKQEKVSIGLLAKRYNLSRSTLLYYEKIGLLVPSNRTTAGYRLYSWENIKQLESILLFRSTGLSLSQLKELLNPINSQIKTKPFHQILETRLGQINADIDDLRSQQRVLVDLLHNNQQPIIEQKIDKKLWSEMLEHAGLDEAGMLEWHSQFEKRAPREHHKFLASLGLQPEEIQSIRENSVI